MLAKQATCPLCGEIVIPDLSFEDLGVVYMDGWHHRHCLDEYFYGAEEQLPQEENY